MTEMEKKVLEINDEEKEVLLDMMLGYFKEMDNTRVQNWKLASEDHEGKYRDLVDRTEALVVRNTDIAKGLYRKMFAVDFEGEKDGQQD